MGLKHLMGLNLVLDGVGDFVIGLQGVALMISEKVNLFDPRELAVGAVILAVGVDVFGFQFPAIATAAVPGFVWNAIFLLTTKRETAA